MALTFSITGGADAAKFTIGASTGVLAFKTAPDFEQPGDADANNIYVVEVGVSDGTTTTKQTINVTVTDVVENLPPQITSPATAAVKEGDTAVMTVTATDPDEQTPPPVTSGTIPLSWDDARFNGNTTSGAISIPSGGTRENLSIAVSGSLASILTSNGATIRKCRVDSREAVRVGGNGNFIIDNCYLRAFGTGADHADTIQAYSPGSRGTIKVTNSTLVNGGAATAGLFVSDNWAGTVDLENVCFIEGPYGVRIHADGGGASGDIHVKFKNVFFVGPFTNAACWVDERTINGSKNIIDLWENVCNATIVSGALVPGSAIPRPF